MSLKNKLTQIIIKAVGEDIPIYKEVGRECLSCGVKEGEIHDSHCSYICARQRNRALADFRAKAPMIAEQVLGEIVNAFVKEITTPTCMTDTGVCTDKITYDCIKWRAEKFINSLK